MKDVLKEDIALQNTFKKEMLHGDMKIVYQYLKWSYRELNNGIQITLSYRRTINLYRFVLSLELIIMMAEMALLFALA